MVNEEVLEFTVFESTIDINLQEFYASLKMF